MRKESVNVFGMRPDSVVCLDQGSVISYLLCLVATTSVEGALTQLVLNILEIRMGVIFICFSVDGVLVAHQNKKTTKKHIMVPCVQRTYCNNKINVNVPYIYIL